jgi:hypothetical protein
MFKKIKRSGCQLQEAEIRRIWVQSQPGQIVPETLSLKTLHRLGAGGSYL